MMKKWKEKIPYVIFLIGIFVDVVVNLRGDYCIIVTEAYMDYIFAGIITVSILCFTFVTLISTFLDNSYLGYKLKDIIQFSGSPVNMKKYIVVSLSAIAIGVCLLCANFIINCANSMTALLLSLVLLEGNVAFGIYEMITNENYVSDFVISHFSANANRNEMGLKEFQSHTDTIVSALSTAINERNYIEKDKICDMLAVLSDQVKAKDVKERYYDYYRYFDIKLRTHMDAFAKVFGYNEMAEFVVKIYARMSNFEYGRIDLYVIPLKSMRFWKDQLLLENNYFKQMIEIDLLNIYREKKISNTEIERIFFVYFESIVHNDLCTRNVRKQLMEDYIIALMKLQWNTNEDGIEPDVSSLLTVLKDFVLKNNNVEERNYIFEIIIRQAFYNKFSYNKQKYFDFLLLLFQAFYAFIFREDETLNQNYREGLQETFAMEFSSETIVKMSASWLLRTNVQEILRAIGRRIQSESDALERRFENHFPFPKFKTTVWTPEFSIDFMLMLYLIFNDEVGFYNIYKDFFNEDAQNDECKLNVLGEFQKQFDVGTGLLKDSFIEQYKQYGKLLQHSSNITEQIQKELFQYISGEYTSIKQKKTNESGPMPIVCSDVMKIINELMEKQGIFGWVDSQHFTELHRKSVMLDFRINKEYLKPQNTANIIQMKIIEVVKSYIRQCANKLVLSSDIEGVKKMHEFICTNKYDARNYRDDWQLKKLRDKPEFKRLEEEQKKIEFVSTPQIYDKLYFNKDKFCFNIKISKIDVVVLSERECAEYLENSKCYNGLYIVDGALMSKEEAMKCIKKIYRNVRHSVELVTCLEKNDVTCIEFEH